MLVGETAYVQWVTWPSRETEERAYALAGFPYSYLVCRKELGLDLPRSLVNRVETTVKPVIERLSESFAEARLETGGRLVAIEVVREDGKRSLLSLDSYFTAPVKTGLQPNEWLEQWIRVELADEAASTP